MALIRKRKIWWEHVAEAATYIVYVSKDSRAFDPDTFTWESTPGIVFKPVSGKTELVIPDDWPDFPGEAGTYHIGITSKDDLGNQSDPFLSSAQFKFYAPASPLKGGIDTV